MSRNLLAVRRSRLVVLAVIATLTILSSNILPLAAAQTEDKSAPVPATILPLPEPTLPEALQSAAAISAQEKYTGIVIDARHLPGISRSPSPTIYGPAPEDVLIYPDRKHLPKPEYLQEVGIVRYYHGIEAMYQGRVVGAHPLILRAVEVLGPAKDGLRIRAEDVERLRNADKECQFTHHWKVAFLLPEDK